MERGNKKASACFINLKAVVIIIIIYARTIRLFICVYYNYYYYYYYTAVVVVVVIILYESYVRAVLKYTARALSRRQWEKG